jgi:hypothetical protein
MDYWADRVSFVGSRIFLFHSLLSPEVLKKKSQLSHGRQKGWAKCFHRLILTTGFAYT